MNREEIRKLLGSYLFYEKLTGYDDDDMDELLRDLSALGVVIKVDELPCPRCKGSGEVRKWQEQYVGEGYWIRITCPKCKGTGKSGYVAVEPLVE